MTHLRPYQLDILDRARTAVAQGARSVLLTLFCGLGKTRTAASAIHSHLELGGIGALFLVPRRELARQARRALGDDPRIHVMTIQALLVAKELPRVSLVVVDEARHALSDEWSRVRELFPDALFIGLDATPERSDGRALGGMFDALIPGISIREAIAQGYLVQPDMVRPPHALGPNELAQDPVDAYFEHAAGTKAIGFFSSVALAQSYAAAFNARGVRAAAVWGDMPVRDRDAALEALERGDLDVVTNQYLLGEGVDIVSVETVILGRRFNSAGAYMQAGGRALRPSPGKTRALILDLCGVSHDLGDLDEERTYHLDGKAIRRAVDTIDVQFCKVCGAPVVGATCETCGYEGSEGFASRKPRILGLKLARFARIRQDDDDARAERLAKWLRLARTKNWKEGQALHRFKAAYGEWPSRALVSRARALA